MKVVFKDDDLCRLYTDETYTMGCSPAIVRAYRKVVQVIHDAHDERDFYHLKSLRFEKLAGKRSNQHSMRLNEKYRLIVELRGRQPNKKVRIIRIEDYH